jgi:NitT/TauT family transport system ATP-binding protein
MCAVTASSPTAAHVTVRDLHHTYGTDTAAIVALAGVSLAVARGEFVSIIGPSGCGKTTLLRAVGGLIAPQRGEVRVDGAPPRAAQRAKAIGMVFQDPALLPWRSVAANVRLPLEVNRRAGRGRRADVSALLALVGMERFAAAYPHQLSGGMRQRVALARALAADPPLLLMDEPFGALDELTRAELRYELLRITARTGKTVLFVTHSIAEAVLLSDRVAVMTPRPGRIRAVVPIALPRPRSAAQETSAAFVEHVRLLRELLGLAALGGTVPTAGGGNGHPEAATAAG